MFLAVVEDRSFTRAAARLGLSQSGLSHAIRRLESRLGLRLLSRTTRSLAPTEAGEEVLKTLRPALADIQDRLVSLAQFRDRPAGTIRITTPEHAARTILWPAVDRLTAGNPDIHVELNVESGLSDLVAERFDAGVRLGERLEKDMIAVRISPRLRMAAVGAPSYFARRGVPVTPHDLSLHACINLRLASAGILYGWEFEKDGHALEVRVEGQLVFNRVDLIVRAATAGHGIGFVGEEHVAELIADGRLARVLEEWCEPFDGYYLYYPSRRQNSVAFNMFVEAVRFRD